MPYYPDTELFSYIVEYGENYSLSKGVKLYYLISKPLVFLSAYELEVYLLFQQFIFVLSLMFLWRGWELYSDKVAIEPGSFTLFTVLAVLYPSTLLYITIPLREFIQILGFSIFLYGLSKNLNDASWGWMILGAVVTVFVRPQLIVFYPLLFLIAKQPNVFKLALYGLAMTPVLIAAFKLVGFKFRVAWFAYLRNAGVKNFGDSGMTYGAVEWQSYFDIAIDLPVLALQFILSPLPILHDRNPFSMGMLMLDLIFVLIVIFGAVSVKSKVSGVFLKMFLFSILIFSMWEFFIGGAVRHRYPLVLMILPLASYYYSQLFLKISERNR